MNIRHLTWVASLLLLPFATYTEAQDRWHLTDDGGIAWNVTNNLPHNDHVEMSGKRVSVVLRYGVDAQGGFVLNKSMVWPLLRTIPNNTHASLMRRFDWDVMDVVTINGRAITPSEKVERIYQKGLLTVESSYDGGWYGSCRLTRQYLPSTEHPALIEHYTLVNTSKHLMTVEIPQINITSQTDPQKGVLGAYRIEMKADKQGAFTVKPGESLSFGTTLAAYQPTESSLNFNVEQEMAARQTLVSEWMDNLVLTTPDQTIDRMFAFSKIRACESIYQTQGGPMHGPGGESYYAAIWANDQAEYINPYFPYTGYDYGCESALNSFRHFARFMNDEWKPIPSSIVAEGLDIWNGVGDRGDAAMIAYGASRYALARGNRQEAEELWPLITWCLEYCQRKLNEGGVVASDTDELENRFPSGKANLCTSSLYYDALLSASCLARELRKEGASAYQKQAAQLRKNIESYFGANVEGFDTYRYYDGNDILRSWICIPLCVGINERAEGTIKALFSPRLWTENGLLTQAGSETFWDRSTLYALRGVYAVGATEQATDYLHRYSTTRLLGDHVPYAIEAWPEGNQRHLSAESGLFGRIITEGLFGIRPTGLRSFSLTPRLPEAWPEMTLSHVRAFGDDFAIHVSRKRAGVLGVTVTSEGRKTQTFSIREGGTLLIKR